jgi:histidine triad (HIT) family protein
MNECVFCQITTGDLSADVIYEDDVVIALADIYPIRVGHTQIISRKHHPYFEDLPEETASRIIHVGQRLSRVMKTLYGVSRVAFCLPEAITRMRMLMLCQCATRPTLRPGDTSPRKI